MWIEKLGKIQEDLYVIGSKSNPIYLLGEGDFWTLIDGGVSFQHEVIYKDLLEIVGNLDNIKFWVITHAHYDHVGLLPSMAPLLKNVEIICSNETAKNFWRSESIEVIYQLNRAAASLNGIKILDEELFKSSFENLQIIPVKEGDTIEVLAGNDFKILETKGHSNCSISLFDEVNKRLWVADALGEKNNTSEWFPLAFDSVTSYEHSVKKIIDLGAKYIFLGHNGHWDLSVENDMENPLEFLDEIKLTCGSVPDDSKLIQMLHKEFKGYSKEFLPENLHLKSVERLIKNVRKNENERRTVEI